MHVVEDEDLTVFQTGRRYTSAGQIIGIQRVDDKRVRVVDISRGINMLININKDYSGSTLAHHVLGKYDLGDYEQDTLNQELETRIMEVAKKHGI